MGGATFTPSADEIRIAKDGLLLQLEAHGVPITPEVLAFVEHETRVKSHLFAQSRFLNNIVNSITHSEVV